MSAFDIVAGFRIDQRYQLRYILLGDSAVSIELEYMREGVEPLAISKAELKK